MAVLGNARLEASRHASTLQYKPTRDGGGGSFRARFGVEREVKLPDGTTRKDNLLAEGSYSLGSEIQDGYPEFTYGVLKKLGWDVGLKPDELAVISAHRRH